MAYCERRKLCQESTHKIRRNFVKEQDIKGKVDVRYQPTADMVADIGTKSVTSTILNKHMATLNMFKLAIPTG
jgi:hypothetical protein